MAINNCLLPYEIYAQFLIEINHVRFSSREIDIIACILNGRTAKKIAALLSISPKTVATHIRNVMLKLECNSQESIRDFIERSDKLLKIKEHYSSLLIQAAFERNLKEISKLYHKDKPQCLLAYWEDHNYEKPFIQQLRIHLKLAGLVISDGIQKNHESISLLFSKYQEENHIICALSKSQLEELQRKFSQKEIHGEGRVFFFYQIGRR